MTFFYCAIAFSAVSAFYWVRNKIVYYYCKGVLLRSAPTQGECLENFNRLPSYEWMLFAQPFRFNWDSYWKAT